MTTVPAATNTELKVLSLHQPWATFVMLGVKRFETRPGPPNGDMRPEGVRAGIGGCSVNRGDVIGIASTQNAVGITADGLTEGGWSYTYFGPEGEYQPCWCFRTLTLITGGGERDITSELEYGDWTPGRWAIELADPTPCDPTPVSGLQGVWRLTADRLRGKAVA